MVRATLILIDAPMRNADAVRKRIILCIEQTGDELIGYRTYGDHYVQFVVKLKHNDYIPKHQIVLGPALQAGAISGFTITTCHLVRLLFNTAQEVDHLYTFPLRERETCFPSLNEAFEGYLCLSSSLLNEQQSEWIVATARMAQQKQVQGTQGISSSLD